MKHCTGCDTKLPFEKFSKQTKALDGLQTWCKQCVKDRYHRTRPHHLMRVKVRANKIRTENKQRMADYLRTHPCVDCGEPDIVVLEFDHLRDKWKDVSAVMGGCYSWDRIMEEVAKCDVVCANCHRRRTYGRLESTWRTA